jgi:hypothetical protein
MGIVYKIVLCSEDENDMVTYDQFITRDVKKAICMFYDKNCFIIEIKKNDNVILSIYSEIYECEDEEEVKEKRFWFLKGENETPYDDNFVLGILKVQP